MTRRLTLTALAALLLAAPAWSPPARACPKDAAGDVMLLGGHAHGRCHEVLYRACRDEPWRLNGSYADRRSANDAARALRRSGYLTRVDHRPIQP